MTAIIEIEKLTKSYGRHRGIVDIDLDVDEGEAFGFLGPNGAGKTTTIRTLLDHLRPTSGRARIFGIETTVDPVAIHRRLGYLPGEFTLYDKLTGGQTIEYFANLRGGVDPAYQAELIARLDIDPIAQVQGVLEGQQAEDRAGRRAPAPAGPADPRRADVGPRPARPADVLRGHPRGEGRGPDDLPLEPHPVRGREDLRPGRDHPRRPAGPGRPGRGAARPRPPPGRAAVRAATCRSAAFDGLPGVSDVAAEDHTLRMRVSRLDHAGRPGGGRATSCSTSSAASRRSRRRSSPSTAATRPRRPDMADRRPEPPGSRPRRPAPSRCAPASTASAASSARPSATRGGRRSLVGVGPRPAPDRASARRSSPSSRRPSRASSSPTVVAAVPPILQGLAGKAGQRRDAGRLPPVQVRDVLPARRQPLVDPRAVGHARRRGAPRQPRVRRGRADHPAPDRAREAVRPRRRRSRSRSLADLRRARDRRQRGRDAAGRRDLGRRRPPATRSGSACSALAAGVRRVRPRAVPRPWRGGRHRRRGHVRRLHPQRLPGRDPGARAAREPDLVRLDVRTTSRSPASSTGRRWSSSRSSPSCCSPSASRRSSGATSGRRSAIPTPSLPRALVGLRGPGRPGVRREPADGARVGHRARPLRAA